MFLAPESNDYEKEVIYSPGSGASGNIFGEY